MDYMTGSGGSGSAPGGVTQLFAGTNITLSPPDGIGNVTINATEDVTSVASGDTNYITVSPTTGDVVVDIGPDVVATNRNNTYTGGFTSNFNAANIELPTKNLPFPDIPSTDPAGLIFVNGSGSGCVLCVYDTAGNVQYFINNITSAFYDRANSFSAAGNSFNSNLTVQDPNQPGAGTFFGDGAGTASIGQPVWGTNGQSLTIILNGYQNSTPTVITFENPFQFVADYNCGTTLGVLAGITINTVGITLPIFGAPTTGAISVFGI